MPFAVCISESCPLCTRLAASLSVKYSVTFYFIIVKKRWPILIDTLYQMTNPTLYIYTRNGTPLSVQIGSLVVFWTAFQTPQMSSLISCASHKHKPYSN